MQLENISDNTEAADNEIERNNLLLIPSINNSIELNTSTIIRKSIIDTGKKAFPLSSLYIVNIGSDILKSYLFSRIGIKNLGANAIITDTTKLLIHTVSPITYQNAALVSKQYGKIKKILSSSEEISPIQIQKLSKYNNKVGKILRQGLILNIGASFLPCIGMISIMPILKLLGISEDVSKLAQDYFLPYAFSFPLEMSIYTYEGFLSAIDKEKWLIPYKLLMSLIENGLNIGLIMYLGNTGAGLASLCQSLLGLTAFNIFFLVNQDIKKFNIYKIDFDINIIKKMLKQGIPTSVAQLMLRGTNFGVTILIGQLGESRLAIEHTIMQFLSIGTSLTYGISEAGNRLVAQALGAKDYRYIRILGNTNILMSTSFFLGACIIYNSMPLQLSSFFLDEDFIIESESTIRHIFALACIGKLLNVLYNTASQNLAGIQDTLLVSIINIISSIAIILPIAVINNYLLHYDIYGVNGARDIGISAAAIFAASYWIKQSNYAVKSADFKVENDTSNSKFYGFCNSKFTFFRRNRNTTSLEIIQNADINSVNMQLTDIDEISCLPEEEKQESNNIINKFNSV